ncbi:uncharacterized protein LOC107260786 [Ricinus communis]|uniref:uncharacterized protein LOC107260786 n=1 Tax=Ricinus communis TaxID=3988 RepID=UPI00077213EB|nr:uncharacterized protein LOC107260786 [Ricinus communis]|eukprot:XP_015570786.1 uncharacterized protein LOC107260786 [Ricinus communis]
MATFFKFSAAFALSTAIFFSDVLAVDSKPVTSASPGVSPYVTAPNMSSFFPSPTNEWLTDPPKAEALAPIPSSGEFIGKSSSSSVKLSYHYLTTGSCIIFAIRLLSAV